MVSFILSRRQFKKPHQDVPGGPVVKNPPANAGDMGSIPDLEDPTCHEAAEAECHNYWTQAL